MSSVINQAKRVTAKFGGARRLAHAIKALNISECEITPSSIYRWSYTPEKGGTGGLIPTRDVHVVLAAARLQGIVLSAEDWAPW